MDKIKKFIHIFIMNCSIELPPKKNTIAIVIIVVIALFELWLFYALSTGYIKQLGFFSNMPLRKKVVQPFQLGSLELTPIKKTYAVGEKAVTTVVFKGTNVKAASFGLVIHYNPKTTKIIDVAPIKTTTILAGKKIETKKGIITASLLMPAGKFIEADQEIASIQWQAIAQGEANLAFDFTPASTTDSNIGEFGTGNDLLTSIVNTQYTIGPAR